MVDTGIHKFHLFHTSDLHFYFSTNTKARWWILWSWAYEQTFFPSAKKFFPFSNPNPFPFEPKETKTGRITFLRWKKEKKVLQYLLLGKGYIMLSSIWMLKLGFLTITGCSFWNIFFSSQGGPWSKRLCRPYAYDFDPQNKWNVGSDAFIIAQNINHNRERGVLFKAILYINNTKWVQAKITVKYNL